MSEPKKTPEIRFTGFTDDWEQRKLSDCAGFRRGSFPQPYGKKDWYDGEGAMPFVQVADVSDDMKLVDDTKQKISKANKGKHHSGKKLSEEHKLKISKSLKGKNIQKTQGRNS